MNSFQIIILTACLAGLPFVASSAAAQGTMLTFEFTIDSLIAGSRPWDGTGISSAAVDSGSGSSRAGGGSAIVDNISPRLPIIDGAMEALTRIPAPILDIGKQAALDQFNQRIAPPDPFLCIVKSNRPGGAGLAREGELICTSRELAKIDSINVKFTFEKGRYGGIFGVVLLDSDIGGLVNPVGTTPDSADPLLNSDGGQGYVSQADDLIGYGIFIDEVTRVGLPTNASVRDYLKKFVGVVERKVTEISGTSRALLYGSTVEAARISLGACKYSCRFGDSTLTIRETEDGW